MTRLDYPSLYRYCVLAVRLLGTVSLTSLEREILRFHLPNRKGLYQGYLYLDHAYL